MARLCAARLVKTLLFSKRLAANVARDHAGELVYLAPSTVAMSLTQERWPKLQFFATREAAAT